MNKVMTPDEARAALRDTREADINRLAVASTVSIKTIRRLKRGEVTPHPATLLALTPHLRRKDA